MRILFPLPWVRRELPFLRLRRSLVTRERVRRLLTVSSHNFAAHLAGNLVFSTDLIVVGVLLGAKAAALYGVPARIFALVIGLGTAGPNILLPALSEMEGADEPERQRGYLATGLRVSMAVILLVAMPLVLIPDQLIRAWIGPGYGPSTAVLALLGGVLSSTSRRTSSASTCSRGADSGSSPGCSCPSPWPTSPSRSCSAGSSGIWGVALATVITEAVSTVILIPRSSRPRRASPTAGSRPRRCALRCRRARRAARPRRLQPSGGNGHAALARARRPRLVRGLRGGGLAARAERRRAGRGSSSGTSARGGPGRPSPPSVAVPDRLTTPPP